jgi:protein gp37
MATLSAIEWTETTWNPVTGCSKVSPGCLNCYAERMAKRLAAMGQERYKNGFKVTLHREAIDEPYSWKRPRIVFVNSMSDLFHEKVSFEFIRDVFKAMNENKRHTFQILTKRSSRLVELAPLLKWSENIWMGVTVENNDYVSRVDDLRKVDCAVRFLSLEPLLGPEPDLDFEGIDWVIVGGESGPGARPIEESWVLDIKKGCQKKSIPFFFKQWGGVNKKKAGRLLQGKTWDNYPKEADSTGSPQTKKEPCLL